MNTKNNVTKQKDAIKGMMNGIKTATSAIRLTYGPHGCNAVVEDSRPPYHWIANDAQTIIQAIQVTDKVQKQGLDFLKELSDKANKDSGDGRKTTCIIAETILDEAIKLNVKGVQLKRELDSLIPVIENEINKQKKLISTKEVEQVATIAGESKELGNLLGRIYGSIGADGIIIPEGSGTYETSYQFIEGVRFIDTGYLSPYMAHDEVSLKEGRKETKAIYENPTILVTKRKISHINDINPLLETLSNQRKKDLVIFTDDMDSGVAQLLVKAHVDKILNVLIIKAPTLWKQYAFEDFAKVTGATIVEDASGIDFKNLELKHLGTCGKITVDKDETTVIGGNDISEHLLSLKQENTDDSKLRISFLTTKTCLLKLGANNESELSYIRLKCNDAINSSRLALKDGTVVGGGVCLMNVSKTLPNTTAGRILRQALCAPIKQICVNGDIAFKSTLKFDKNIVDASIVVKNAVRNAISLASTILTTGVVVTLPEKTSEQIAHEMMQQKGIRF